MCGGGVHASQVLGEKVFAVKVVVIDGAVVVGVDGYGAQIAAPEAKLDVLRADVPLPFVLGDEVGLAAVGGEGTGEWAL